MKHNTSSITVGDRVKITTVPSPVKNIDLGIGGVIETEPMIIAGIAQSKVKLDDGRVIKWNIDYLEVIDDLEESSPKKTPISPGILNIPLEKIRLDGGTQPRAFMNGNIVQEYGMEMQQGAVFPPVILFNDGSDYWLADGYHRVAAATALGYTEIKAEVRQGDCRDAVLFSCGVNATHGLRRTNDDKRRAVMRLLKDEEWSQWSNREIAKRANTSEYLVRTLRNSICDKNADTKLNKERKVQRGDTTYTVNTSNIGKAPKLKGKTEATTSVDQELKEQEKRLGLSYNKHTDQVLPDVERHHATTSDIDDRPGASVAIVKMDERSQQAVRAFLDNVETMSDTQLKVMGATLARRCPSKAEVLASVLAGMNEALAVTAVKSAVLVYPEAVARALGRGKCDE